MEQEVISNSLPEKPFSEYPEAMDRFFSEKKVIIKVLPQDFLKNVETRISDINVTSAKQYFDYLDAEIKFWKENDPSNKLTEFSHLNNLESAMKYFKQAETYYASKNYSSGQGDSALRNSINVIQGGCLHSRTVLARVLLTQINKEKNFFRGVRSGLLVNRDASLYSTVADIEGVNFALALLKHKENMPDLLKFSVEELDKRISEANEHYGELNRLYVSSYHEQENRIVRMREQTNEHFQQIETQAKEYFVERDARCTELENLYGEKLKLQAPAEYWKKVEEDYSKKGTWWMVASVGISLATIGTLITLLANLPNLFSVNTHWLDVFKNSAILTIITSIAAYVLRLFVKMAMSSFHLARDAKERNNLTYFYLSLIEKKAVSDKERAIILNSLFSRSDTGLLKGDSSPTMSNNVMELVESFSRKGN